MEFNCANLLEVAIAPASHTIEFAATKLERRQALAPPPLLKLWHSDGCYPSVSS
ncbi:hypothetical protein A2U01_0010640 [Trifolium medium]|uniref:Uncharacterized protein n=1 Tax=Trifolium medium TaxID=97028 RepID=A0A392MRT9_9FABA|nr:hypothetical protein [Trifolium medium]